ncbi:MAG: manganese efflux pump MntP family protein [Alicyclobacillus sp.]|nr:manganese efflux pump MntP family protein [Alicyclobacillus sp.]
MGMNNALASVALGTTSRKRSQQLSTALVFGLFEACMPLLGLWLGNELAQWIGGWAKTLGVAVLALMGIYLLLKRSDSPDLQPGGRSVGWRSLLLGLALSLDNLTVGFGLGMLDVPLGLAALVFGLVSVTMTLLGLEVGRWFGARVSMSADRLSGGLLLLVAGALYVLQ